jgi:uncharacterized caspase-like protein
MKLVFSEKTFCIGLLVLAAAGVQVRAQVLSFEEAKQRADAGDAFAQAVVALHYQLGWNTEKNPYAATTYAMASANAGHPLGKFRFGALLRAGEGMPKNEKQGLALQAASFKALYNAQDPYSMTSAAIMIFQGKVVGQNISQAERRRDAATLYKKAADMGYAPAQFNYAMAANDGHGVAQDPDICANYLSKSLGASYPPALTFQAEKKASEISDSSAIGRAATIPLLPSAIAKARLNPTTHIYEKPEEQGKSEIWHSLNTEANPEGVEISLRMNYSGLPLAYQGNSEEMMDTTASYDSWSRQSMWRSGQYEVKSSGAAGVVIAPVLSLEERNLGCITEYPACFEIEIKNNSQVPLSVQSFSLEVKSAVPEDKIIPHLIVDKDGKSLFHNFGWDTIRDWRGEFYLLVMEQAGYVVKDKLAIANIEQGVDFDITRFLTVPENKTEYYTSEGSYFHAPEYLAKASCVNADGSALTRNWAFGTSGFQDVFYHTVYPPDLELPAEKSGYLVNYAIVSTIDPQKSARYSFTIGASRSGCFQMMPKLVIDGDNPLQLRPLTVHLERAREVPSRPPAKALHMDNGGDAASDTDYQMQILKAVSRRFPPHPGHGTPEWLAELNMCLGRLSAEDARLRYGHFPNAVQRYLRTGGNLSKARAAVNTLLGDGLTEVKFPHKLYPNVQDSVIAKSFPRIKGQKLGEVTVGGKAAVFLLRNRLRTMNGTLEVRDTLSNQPVAQIPWAYKESPENLPVAVVASKAGDWLAWTFGKSPNTKLYVALKKISDSVFSLPLVDEEHIDEIGLSQDGTSLVVSVGGQLRQLELSSPLAPLLAGCLRSAVTEVYCDEIGRVRLWLPVGGVVSSMQKSEKSVFSPSSPEPAAPAAKLTWFGNSELAVGGNIWNIAAGKIYPPSQSDKARISDCIGTPRCSLANSNSIVNTAAYGPLHPIAIDGIGVICVKDARANVGMNAPAPFHSSATEDGAALFIKNGQNEANWFVKDVGRIDTGNFGRRIVPINNLSGAFCVSPDNRKIAFLNSEGTALYIFDISKRQEVLRVLQSPVDPSAISSVTPEGYYLSGDGRADGVVFTDGGRSYGVSQFESKYNRPDIVLERLGDDKSLITEARRLRERLVRRSDFKSFDGATLIDIPVVTVKSEVPEATGEKSLSLDYEAGNSTGPLKELRVFNNGALVKTLELKGKDGQPSREASGEVEIDLASGENRLQLMAVSEEGFTSSFAEKRVNRTAEPDSRRCFIAAVGVSEYNDPRFNLKLAAKDAEDMSKALAEKARHRGYQPEVLVVKNAEVDSGLVDKLREFLSQAGTDDEVVLFFAGHGLLDKDLEYHFARHDTDFDATENMGITFEALESLVDGIKPLKRTVLFDTCHSGEVEEEDKPQLLAMVSSGDLSPAAAADSGVQVRGVATRGMKVTSAEPKLRHSDFVELEGLFPDSRRAKGANILTSSSGSEFSMESDAWQNGLFTYAFLNALQDEKTDANSDKSVSFNEAATAVQDKVKTLSGGHQRPITRGVNREAEVALASFAPPVAPIPTKEKKSGWWPF